MLRRLMVGGLGAAVLAGAMATGAAASQTTVQLAIVHQDKIISASPGYRVVEHFSQYQAGELGKLAPRVAELSKLYDRAANVVSQATPTTRRDRTGQKDWVAGARLGAVEFTYLAVEMKAVSRGDRAAAESAETKAEKAAKAAVILLHKGNALLGLPPTA